MEIAILNKLLEHEPLYNQIANRFYPLKLPQNPTYPCVTYQKISDPIGEMGTKNPRYQYSIYGTSYGQIKSAEKELKGALDTLEGTANIFASYDDNAMDNYENDTGLYSVIVDAIFYYLEKEEWG